jgi:uncharacterized membrane protein
LVTGLTVAVALPWLLKGLPNPIPTHFDGHGHPNGWTSHAAYPWIGFGLPALVWLLLLGTGAAFAGTDQDPDGRKSAAMAPLRGFTATGLLGLMLAVLLIPRFGFGAIWFMVAVLLCLMVVGGVLMVRALKRDLPETDDQEHYHWGLFYVNAADPRLWVPKRLGLGWTLNFAHGISWFILALLILPPVILIGFVCTH